ncbi:DUF3892 domain-containing protein [Bacillus infantis]|uniref:DUF3892 domain-containing protein n=1 Tax=Bacillus infantis TaxID=324767 RepID=UPI003CE8BF88
MQPEKLIAVQRNHLGEIMSFQTSGGRIISFRKALMEAEEGIIELTGPEHSLVDADVNTVNLLDDFPSF